ncbi:fibrinogen C domain-containing protein 1-A-like [Watersipora subatra]|uniref:fibrinogen C domain-containing protein 1-A-like n=1 Tax=Watersipora subatra TaxID=2589382 RepID=UPI00355C6E09
MPNLLEHLGLLLAAVLITGAQATRLGGPVFTRYCLVQDVKLKPKTCLDLLCRGKKSDGVYIIYPDGDDLFSFEVYCDQTTDGGGWTVFQRRMDGWVDFYRNWRNYRLGFGDVNGEHWLGLDRLTTILSGEDELRVDMEAVSNEKAYAMYSNFSVGDRSTDYVLHVSGYSGTAGDDLSQVHSSMKFSTFDKDNDPDSRNCAQTFHGAWWYNMCHTANLNGNYYNGVHKSFGDGVNWWSWKGRNESLKTTEMKFRKRI